MPAKGYKVHLHFNDVPYSENRRSRVFILRFPVRDELKPDTLNGDALGDFVRGSLEVSNFII